MKGWTGGEITVLYSTMIRGEIEEALDDVDKPIKNDASRQAHGTWYT